MNINNQNDFENQGWDAMLQTLDREMPVKKKRRMLLWLVFFIGLTAALGGGYWYLNTYNLIKTLDKTESKPIVAVQISKNTEEGRILGFYQENKNNNAKVEQNNTNDSILIENNKTVKNNIIQNNNNDSGLTENNKTVENNIVQNNNNDSSLIENNKTVENNIVQNIINDSSLIENNKTVENKIGFNSIELLNKIQIPPLSIKQDTNLKIKPQPIFKTIKCFTGISKKPRLGIISGIHTEKGQKIDGFQAGLVLFKPLNYYWSLSSGLNFRQTQTSGNSITYFKTENLLNAAASSNLQSGKPISLDKLYYLELPLTIQYHFKKKFAFSTGLKTGHLVGQSVKENGTAVYFVNSSFTSLDNKGLLNKVNTTTLGLNRWDISLMGAFSYLPTKHIQLGLRYDFGLTNIINRTNWSAYNRYMGLNIVYLF